MERFTTATGCLDERRFTKIRFMFLPILGEDFTIRAVFSFLMGQLALFLIPIKEYLLLLLFIMTADMVTGIWASIRRKDPIRSNRLRGSVTKLVNYLIAILVSKGVEGVIMPSIPLTHWVTSFVALVEFKSVLENIGDITRTRIDKYVISILPERWRKAIESHSLQGQDDDDYA